MAIGKLDKVPLRELWKHEEYGFSQWLSNNLDILSDVIGIRLALLHREKCAGAFECDLVAEDEEDSDLVIIENQLERTNHDHLGKLVTYLTNLDAKKAIWITKEPRPEHIKAIVWLNETTPNDVAFYLVRLDAYRIGSSDPAPLFTLVVGPSAESKEFGREKKENAERHVLRLKFWESLLGRAKQKGLMLHDSRSPTTQNWISAGAGRSGLSFNYVIWMEEKSAVELYIDTGDKDENKRIFDALIGKKDEIEGSFGSSLLWERLDEKRACRIRHLAHHGGLLSGENQWPGIQDQMIDAMGRLSKALKPRLASRESFEGRYAATPA